MRTLILSVLFISLCGVAKSQCIFIYAAEKIKGAEIPIERTEFHVVINDTMKRTISSHNDGSLGRISLEKGKYKVKISSEEFADGISEEVIVKESRSTDVIIPLVRLTPAQIEEKKKASKK
ncbi:MAG: hypothetical protein K0S32_753 [Bacteroidetes bacterium]|jgi:hypothetical protein|nr:hypothetical protein [Bacteroidota bacterium]